MAAWSSASLFIIDVFPVQKQHIFDFTNVPSYVDKWRFVRNYALQTKILYVRENSTYKV